MRLFYKKIVTYTSDQAIQRRKSDKITHFAPKKNKIQPIGFCLSKNMCKCQIGDHSASLNF